MLPNISIMYFVLSNTSQRTTKMLKINEDGNGLYSAQFLEPIARPSATLLLAKYTWIFFAKSLLNTSVFRIVPTVYFEVLDSTHRTAKTTTINQDGNGLYFVQFLEAIARTNFMRKNLLNSSSMAPNVRLYLQPKYFTTRIDIK